MNRELARQALLLFEQTLDLPDEERAAVLREACADNPNLREKVQRLYAAQDAATDLLPSAELDPQDHAEAAGGPDDACLPAGTCLADRYRIIESIGTGGMGAVYRARDDRLDRDVAIKMLHRSSRHDQQMQRRFERELKSVAALSHPNIVTMYDVGTHEGATFAVMELVQGRTLRTVMAERPHWRTAVLLIRDVALGLAAAHDRDMMHRDIKPENIIVTGDGRARVLDFGLARPEARSSDQNLTSSQMVAGTVPYMSPEQVDSGELSRSTDIFSLGTVLYELLSGVHPFRDHGALQTMQRVSAATPQPLQELAEGVPAAVVELLNSMLTREPQQRPAARGLAGQLATLVSAADSTTSVSATPLVRPASMGQGRFATRQPSLIVLPFQTFGSEHDLEPLADGLVENLTTVLTRIPMLSLTSRMSSFAVKGQATTADEIRRRFDVDYMIEGSLQRLGEQLRANVQLIDTRNSFHLWAQHFDCPTDSDALITLLESILPRLEPQLTRAIFNDLQNETEELSGRQLLMQAMSVLSLKGWHVESFSEVAELLHQSLELEPDFALTHAYLALIRGLGKRIGLVTDPVSAARDAINHAERALDLEDMDSNVLGLAGCALADVGETDQAIPILHNAIELNPNNAQAHAALGGAYLAVNHCQHAIEHLQTGIRISPMDARLAVWYAMLGTAWIRMDDAEQACEAAQKGCRADRRTYLPRVVLSAAHFIRGEVDEASAAVRDARRAKPDLSQQEIASLIGPELGSAVGKLADSHRA